MTDDKTSKTAKKSELSLLKKNAFINKYTDKNKSPNESQFALDSGENIISDANVKIKTKRIISKFRSFFTF